MKKNTLSITIILSVIIVISSAIICFNLYTNWSSKTVEQDSNVASLTNTTDQKDLQSIIHEAQKNVVQISVETASSEKTGSGFLYNSNGDIITNAHVIEDAESITVTMSNAETYKAAIVKMGDKKDIAVIRVPQLINQTPVDIASSEKLGIGDEIIAVGSPLGFQNSVSIGIISGIDRSFEIDTFSYDNVYQISANITHGNSGGPLINRSTGEVVGINSAGIDESEIAFSIPIGNVIEDVTEWSRSVSDEELIYPVASYNINSDPTQMQEDADYLISYFFESIKIHDYINAYTLLGSSLQTETGYTDFRKSYIYHISLEVSESKTTYLEDDNQVEIITDVEVVHVDSENEPETRTYTFTVGYENDQLKIIELNKEEVSD
ncbi:S1C family serine protease [Paraliobacillus zengyii]|uniref:S1C family serine protease n=1 Tax=Paraliobacillus zengyii TaxID=2213194 RepID=UPI000DD3EBAE|nr:trypsin-like peptidase domain-containing protein [Paraliobacillus zengyii]